MRRFDLWPWIWPWPWKWPWKWENMSLGFNGSISVPNGQKSFKFCVSSCFLAYVWLFEKKSWAKCLLPVEPEVHINIWFLKVRLYCFRYLFHIWHKDFSHYGQHFVNWQLFSISYRLAARWPQTSGLTTGSAFSDRKSRVVPHFEGI